MGEDMKSISGLAFCLLLGASVAGQGWTALFWVPIGFAFGLYATAQIVLPIMLGLPRAIALVVKGQMRSAVFGAMILTRCKDTLDCKELLRTVTNRVEEKSDHE